MNHALNPEMFWLVATVLMTSLFWIPYILNRMVELGPITAILFRFPEPGARAAWADRMQKAHLNAVENLVIFAPLVLALQVQGISTSTTTLACAIYFWARLTHYLVFTFAVPLLRVAAFMVGFAAQMTLAVTLLFG